MSSSNRQEATPYELRFLKVALKEWGKLSSTIQRQFASKLQERLRNPRVEADKLRGHPDCYKIKLRSSGFRLVYEVIDDEVVVMVVAVGKRDRSKVYRDAGRRLE